DYEYYEIDFKNYSVKDVTYIKVQGLSAINHPFGYGLMNIYGFDEPPTKLVESTTHVLETKDEKKEVIVIQDMLFEFNDSLIRNEELVKLDSICDVLTSKQIDSLIISGHTDSVGNAEYNLKLSLARAKTIADYLVTCGIKRRKLNVVGYGETQLIDSIRGDDSGNRRVEIEIIYDE
ncbi:MAG: OmpA family protein, partial [Bacteroidales bacterium]|nr:OmpA family protein [Bacteroidales bacterium]